MKTKVLRDKPVIERCKMLPKTSVNYTRKVNDYDIDVRCRGGCEYCTDDAFYIDDLLQNPSESMRSFTTDPRVAVLGGNHAELYVENVIEINSHKSDRNSLRKKDNGRTTKMSSSRRVSRPKQDDGEFLLECKAAFLSMYDDIGDRISSKKDLLTVLQQSGRNPSNRVLEKYWPRHTDELSFNDFVDVCRKEPVTTTDDLMKAFKKIDINGDGYISLDELHKIMNSKGESMSREEVWKMIDDVDENKDGRLDYGEFCNMIMKTTNDCKKMSMKMMERKERKKGKTGIRPDISGNKHEHEKEESPKHSNNHHQELHHHNSKKLDAKEKLQGSKSEASTTKSESASPKTPRDAEQVEEDIQVNDDLDIISSGRPTPKIDLKASPRKDSLESKHKTEHKKVAEAISDKKSSAETHKGKTYSTGDDALHALQNGDGMRSTSSEKIKAHKTVTDSKPVTEKTEGVKIEKQEYTKSGIAIVVTEDGDDRIKQDSKGKPNSMMSDDGKNKETEKAVGKSDKKQDEAVKSAQLIDEIFKTTYILPQVEKTEIKRLENEETIYNVEKKKHDEETIYKVEKKKHDDQTHTARLLDKIFKRSSPRSASDEKIKSSEMQKTAHKTEIKDSDDKKSSSRLLDEIFKTTTPRSERYEDTKTQDTEKLAKKSDKTNHDQDHSARLMDEIFKTSAKLHKDVTQDMYVLGKDEEERKHSIEKRMSVSETKPPRPKERTHANTMTPRLDSAQTKEETMALGFGERGIKLQKEDSETKSSDKHSDIGAPVPSPRKAISRVSEDDMPRPSPRVRPRDQKPKTSARGKLPDPRTLRDWSMQTSKGSFFYEDDEIVTHVYNLNLREESAVYFTAYPIQEPASLALPSHEPVDTALYILDSRGKLVTFTEQTDSKGRYGVKCDLSPGEYQIVPYTTGCRFKQRTSSSDHMREAKLVKKDKDDKIVITSAFRKALEDIFDLCDLDDNGTMSKNEFNWFNVRTSGEELGDDEWEVVEERTSLEGGEITKKGFIALNEMEAEDSNGEVDDLWITLSSMGFNKALIMDEACPFRVEVYVERTGRREPKFKCTGIESLQKKELVQEICQSVIEKSQSEPVKIRNMKDLYMHTYKNDHRASIALENRSRSRVNVEVDCNKSKNAVSHRDSLDHTVEVEPQSMAIAHHLVPAREGADWTVICTETVHK